MIAPRFTYANVMSTLAVFLALGGTGYAALTITGKNVKDGSLTGRDIRSSSVSARHVKDGSLLASDFKPAQLPAGPAGARGPMGAQGPPGQRGPSGPAGAPAATNVTVRSASATGKGSATATASCAPGERAVSGGFDIGGWGATVSPFRSAPVPNETGATPTGWQATMLNQTSVSASTGVTTYVVCASP